MKQWRLQHGENYLVTGQPVIVADLTGTIPDDSIELLLVAVMLVMAGTLSLIFRGPPRDCCRWRSRCSPSRSRSARCRSWGRR